MSDREITDYLGDRKASHELRMNIINYWKQRGKIAEVKITPFQFNNQTLYKLESNVEASWR